MTGFKKLLSVLLSAAILCGNIGMAFAADSASSVPSGGGGGIDVSGFTYVVDNMQFWSGDTKIEAPNGSCEVSVDMTKRKQSNDRDKLIIAAYSDTDKLIGMYTVVHDIEFGKTSNIKVSVTVSKGDVLGNVKAFVWDSFGGMRALSNTISRYNNGEIDPMLEYDEEQQTSFPDVSKDSDYAEAIEFLATLGVLNGNSNGYFNPTGSVNRAAAAAVISHIAGRDEEAYYLRGESIYTDTEPGNILTGYLNLGYIEPISAGVIAPYDNITAGQFIKAVIKALGYEEMAEVQGGWPIGYIRTANSIGLMSGVKSHISDTLIREELAMICFNAINAPIIETVGYEYTASGELVPKKVIMNGENANYYKSFLTEVFNIYTVEGFVVETDKTGALKQGEVKFGIAKTERYENDYFSYNSFNYQREVFSIEEVMADSARIVTVNVGNTNAADYEGIYAKAMIKEENGDYVIISFLPAESNDNNEDTGKDDENKEDVVEDNNINFIFDAELYDPDANTDFLNGYANYLNIYETESATTPTRYRIKTDENNNPQLTVYINGEEQSGYPTGAEINSAIVKATGDVKLVDTYETDGYYDVLYVNQYETVQVAAVLTSQKKIIFTNTSSQSSLVLDSYNENLVYNIYLDGEKIELSELKENDVLSIAYTGNSFSSSTHYEIYVSREVVTGVLSGISTVYKTITIADTKYKFYNNPTTLPLTSQNIGEYYTLFLDNFGRIFKYELKLNAGNYAVLDKAVYSAVDEILKLTMYTADGESKTVVLDGSKATIKVNGTAQTYTGTTAAAKKTALETDVKNRVYTTGTTREPIETRIVKYKVSNSTGRVIELDFITGTQSYGTYKSSTGAIGSANIGDVTKIIDAVKYLSSGAYSDLDIATKAWFINNENYAVYSYGPKIDGYHPFVLVTAGVADYNSSTRFAVIADGVSDEQDEAGDPIYVIPALYFDAEAEDNTVAKRLIVSDEIERTQLDNLQVGDVIVFTTDKRGYIDGYSVIFDFSEANPYGYADISDYISLVSYTLFDNHDTALFGSVVKLPTGNISTDWVSTWAGYSASVTEPIQLVFGPIVTSTPMSVGIAKINNMKTDLNHNEKDYANDGVYEIDLDSDTAVYEYDYSQSKKNRLNVSTAASIRPSIIVNNNYIEDVIDWSYADNKLNVNFAFALVVNGVAKDVLVFNAK